MRAHDGNVQNLVDKDASILPLFDTLAQALRGLSSLNREEAGSHECDQLKRKLEKLEQQNVKLKAEIYDAKLGENELIANLKLQHEKEMLDLSNKSKQKLRQAHDSYSTQFSQLQEDAKRAHVEAERCSQLEHEIGRLRQQMRTMSDQLSDTSNRESSLKEQIQTMSAELEKTRFELNVKASEVMTSNRTAAMHMTTLTAKVAAKEKQVTQLQTNLLERASAVADLTH